MPPTEGLPTAGLRQRFRLPFTFYLLGLVVVSTLGPLQFGFHLAELNAPQDVISCRKKIVKSALHSAWDSIMGDDDNPAAASASSLPDCIPMTDFQFALVTSLFTAGGLVGALGSGPIASSRGRLPAMRLSALFFAIGSAVETVAPSIPVMCIGRFLAGVGAGAATVIVPIYISEVATPSERGTFGAMTQVSINVGILGVQTLGYFLSHDSAWRWILGIGAIVGGLQTIGLLFVPESPPWLATHKSLATARRTLQRIRGRHSNISEEVSAWGPNTIDTDAEGTIAPRPEEEEALLNTDELTPPHSPISSRSSASRRASATGKVGAGGRQGGKNLGFFQVARDPFYRPALIACVGAMCSQQLCGINSIIMYSVSLLRDLLPFNSTLLTILISAINLFITILCARLPDKLGRRKCLLLSITGQGVSSLALALSIVFGVQILSAFMVLLFVAFFAVGLGPVPFMLASELVGTEAVGATQSWCLASSNITTFIVAQFFPVINAELNRALGRAGWVYFIFAALAFLCGCFVYWLVPESKGKKDADEVWGRPAQRLD